MSIPVNPPAVVDDPKRPWKALVAAAIPVLIAVVQLVQVALGDNVWDANDTLNVILGALGAIAVYFVENPKVEDDRAKGL